MMTRRRRGFTLIEMMFVIAFFCLVVGFMGNAMVQATRVQNITGAQYDMQRQGRHDVDVMIDDIHDSQLVLSSYTYNSVVYSSSTNGTLVLQAPSYDASGNALGSNDFIIYHLSGTSAPYTLKRIVVPAAGSARVAVNDVAVASNVLSLTFTYKADQGIVGDGVTKVFTLTAFPSGVPAVVYNGSSLVAGAAYSFTAPQTVTFTSAPAGPDAVDIISPVDPAVSPSQVTTVSVDLLLRNVSSAFQDAAKTQSVEITSKTGLRNH